MTARQMDRAVAIAWGAGVVGVLVVLAIRYDGLALLGQVFAWLWMLAPFLFVIGVSLMVGWFAGHRTGYWEGRRATEQDVARAAVRHEGVGVLRAVQR